MKLMFGRKASRIQDLFQTTLYAGTGSTQNIVTGLDMANKNGLVWIKARNYSVSHFLGNTIRGAGYALVSDSDGSETYSLSTLTEFLSDGFSVGVALAVNQYYNYVAWTFMRGVKFFDFTTVSKSSGSDSTVDFPKLFELGMVFVKALDATGNWFVWHRSLSSGELLYLNTTDEASPMGHITVSGSIVTLVDGVIANGNYIVFAFAHDALPGGRVQAGSYVGNGSTTGPEIDLGWRPQYLMVKVISGERRDWAVYDNKRNTSNPRSDALRPSSTGAEITPAWDVDFTATGFQPRVTTNINKIDHTYAYLAIREEE